MTNKTLSLTEKEALLQTLKSRFDKNLSRHLGVDWSTVLVRLESKPDRLWSLNEMEKTGGEPDVVSQDRETGEYLFFDCSSETPKDRRSYCYDKEALDNRKSLKPKNTVIDVCARMGIELLTEDQYKHLQKLGKFDTKTSSWLLTPPAIRNNGGAIFGDRRYDHVFVYHNGADSYYAARGFRGVLRV